MIINDTDPIARAGEQLGAYLDNLMSDARTTIMTVIRIDESYAYCTIFEDDEPLPVPLSMSGVGNVSIYPEIGSTVLVGWMNGNNDTPVLLSYSTPDRIVVKRNGVFIDIDLTDGEELAFIDINNFSIRLNKDEFFISNGESSFKMEGNVITMNGGQLNGLVEVVRLTDRLNKLQSELNSAISTINSHVHTSTWTSSAGSAPTSPPLSAATPPSTFSRSDYENENVKQ